MTVQQSFSAKMTWQIGPYQFLSPLVLAPMAGITDCIFRDLCSQWGASLTFAEMVSANDQLWSSAKSTSRRIFNNNQAIKAIQLLGVKPEELARAAAKHAENGIQLIDINMGCPAKKVCRQAAGSALLRDLILVKKILQAVVKAVNIPVTLKVRTGWDHAHINVVEVAQLAEQCGIQAITVHGRYAQQGFSGTVDYAVIAQVKQAVHIPVIANGDITNATLAKKILTTTKADAIMIGRAALGQPWFFRELYHALIGQKILTVPLAEKRKVIQTHLKGLYFHYGSTLGVRLARKHMNWYLQRYVQDQKLHQLFNQLSTDVDQLNFVAHYFSEHHLNTYH